METIKAIIIDDEPGNIVTLKGLLASYCTQIDIIDTAPDPVKGFDIINDKKPDLVFLDVEMPYGNAFDLLDKLKPITFEVVFITAFNQYAIQAFKYAAIDYILKPVNITELQQAVEKVQTRLAEKKVNTRILHLLNNLQTSNKTMQKLALPTMDGLVFEDINTISHLIAEGSYTQFYFTKNKSMLVTKSLKEFEDILPDDIFFRTHHSSIISVNYIKKYHKGRGGYIEMQDGTIIEVATRKKNAFLEKFMQ